LRDIGRRDLEIEGILREIEQQPGDAALRLRLARAWESRGIHSLALDSANAAMKLQPDLDGASEFGIALVEGAVESDSDYGTAIHPTEGRQPSVALDAYERMPLLVRGLLWSALYVGGFLIWRPWGDLAVVVFQSGMSRLRAARFDKVARLYLAWQRYSELRAFELTVVGAAAGVPILLLGVAILFGRIPGVPAGTVLLGALLLASAALLAILAIGLTKGRRKYGM